MVQKLWLTNLANKQIRIGSREDIINVKRSAEPMKKKEGFKMAQRWNKSILAFPIIVLAVDWKCTSSSSTPQDARTHMLVLLVV